jgi:hypothetical protein
MFFEDYPIYYINLLNREDRNKQILEHLNSLNLNNFIRVPAMTPEDVNQETMLLGKSLGCTEAEIATSYSHINALKTFLQTSDKEYAIFCEDDADLSNLKKINFTISDLFNANPDIKCFQLGVSTREEVIINFTMHQRGPWDFNASTYAITRNYAEKLVLKYYKNNEFILNNFTQTNIIDPRNNSIINSTPVSEYIIYGSTNTKTCPIFSFIISESSIQSSVEHTRQNVKSLNDFINYWNRYENINYYDLISTNKSFFSKSELNYIKINKNVKVVIPWRKSESRINIFNFLINWYKNNFPEWEIILSDSKSELFNLSASRNQGIKKSFELGADIVLVTDADFFPSKDSLIKAILIADKTNELTLPYNTYIELTYDGTNEFINMNPNSLNMYNKKNGNPELIDGKTNRFWVCSGMNIITKSLFEDFGGFDENYVGWGHEDTDYHKRYLDKYGKLFTYIEGIGCSLEHSRDEWKTTDNTNLEYFKSKHGDNYVF